eukprot:2162089-Rhodomonas_salina.1
MLASTGGRMTPSPGSISSKTCTAMDEISRRSRRGTKSRTGHHHLRDAKLIPCSSWDFADRSKSASLPCQYRFTPMTVGYRLP